MENLYVFAVVPHAGTWIAICHMTLYSLVYPSFPTRERGLKYYVIPHLVYEPCVVPHAGTWIEIQLIMLIVNENESFPTRERGLKSKTINNIGANIASFPTRERGLKYQ